MKLWIAMARAICVLAVFVAIAASASAQNTGTTFASRDAAVDGLTIHYTKGGSGPVVILLHGFAETSRMWNPILPVLGRNLR